MHISPLCLPLKKKKPKSFVYNLKLGTSFVGQARCPKFSFKKHLGTLSVFCIPVTPSPLLLSISGIL